MKKYLQCKPFVSNDWWSWGFVEEKNGSKYLVFHLADENKEILKNTTNFGMGLKMKLRP